MMTIFGLVGVGEKQGGGIPLMFETAKKEGLHEPTIEVHSDLNRTFISFFLNKQIFATPITTPIPSQDSKNERIIRLIRTNPYITQLEIAKDVGITIDGVKYITGVLKKSGRIKREGSNRNGMWVVCK